MAAIILAVIVLALGTIIILPQRVPELASSRTSFWWKLRGLLIPGSGTPPSGTQSRITLSPLIVCTGLDAQGSPVGAAVSFREDQVASTGLIVYVKYSDAVPHGSTFQLRWNYGDQTFASPAYPFETASDYIGLNLGKDWPAGDYQIEFLVDGAVRSSTSIVVGAASAKKAGLAGRRQKPVIQTAVKPVEMPPPAPVPAPPPPPVIVPKEEPKASVLPQALAYKVKHWHRFGSCTGDLKLTPGGIEFSSDQHSFKFEMNEVKVHDDGIQEGSGKTWQFFMPNASVEDLLRKWKRGELFPDSRPAPAAGQPPEQGVTRSYKARHKHLLGSCDGELIFTPDSVEFASVEHYFKCGRGDARIDKDTIQDGKGRAWRLSIPTDDVEDLLHLWKAGKLWAR